MPEEFASITASDSVLALSIGKRSRTIFSILQSARLAGFGATSIMQQELYVPKEEEKKTREIIRNLDL